MGNDFTTAGALFAGSNGPLTMSWTLFAALFAAANDPLQADVNAIIGALTAWLLPILRIAAIVGLIVSIVGVMIADHVGAVLPINVVLRYLLRAAVLISLMGGVGVFSQWVSQPLLNLPNEISGVVLGATRFGRLANGGAPFDALWDHVFVACLKTASAVSFFSIEGIVLGGITFLVALFSILFISYMFVEYLIAYVLLSIIIAVSPLFVATLIWRGTARFFSGWIAGVGGAILTLVLISVMLSILIRTQQLAIDTIMNAGPNANTLGMIGSVIGMGALTFIGALMTRKIHALSVGLAGGVYHESNTYYSALNSMGTAAATRAGNWLGGGVTGATPAPVAMRSSAAGGVAPAGRSLSGKRP